jgi:GNAT superfamily N-acetyltransferase
MAELEVTDAPATADVEALLSALIAFNEPYLGQRDARPLAVIVRGEGRLISGLSGMTARGFLSVELFWVAPDRRGLGLGSRVLQAAEAEARRRGCHSAYLDTFDFQARGFYERHGYRMFGELAGFPGGHRRLYMAKHLEAAGGG